MMAAKHVPAPSIWLIIHILSMYYYARTLVFITSNVSMITACDRPLLWWWLAIMCLFLPIHITGWNFLPFNVCYDLCQGHISGVNLVVGFFAVLTKILKYIYVYLEKLENIWELHQICQSHAAFMIQCGPLWWWLGLPGVFGNKHHFSSLEENATSVLLKSSWYSETLPVEVGDQHLQTTWWLSSPPPSVPSGVLPPPSQTFCHLLPPLTLPLPVIFSTTTP